MTHADSHIAHADVPYHVPVMLHPTVDGLRVAPGGVYADLTFGGGGHSREILRRLEGEGRLYGFDQDTDTLANVPDDPRFTFVHSNFRYLRQWMLYYGVEYLDGILADLGVSGHHFDDASRGFSFRFAGRLDMRMNRSARLTATHVVNTYDEAELTRVFRLYGEISNAGRVAGAVCAARREAEILTVERLLDVIQPLFKREREKKEITKVFQALRIEVNGEMRALEDMLRAAMAMLREGGRLSVLTYHSLEDRLVKNFIRAGNAEGVVEQDFYGNRLSPMMPVNNKVIVADEDEVKANSRSRSAKLRIGERTGLPL